MNRSSVVAAAALLTAATGLAAPSASARPTHSLLYPAHNCGAGTNATTPTASDLSAVFPANFASANVEKLSKINWHTNVTCTRSAKPITHQLRPSLRARSRLTAQQNAGPTSYNWSGYQDQLTPHRSFMAWQVPTNPAPDTSSNVPGATYGGDTQVSIWPGMGNGHSSTNDVLIQNGTETLGHCEIARVNPPQAGQPRSTYCTKWSSSSYFWWETYDDNRKLPENKISDHAVAAGDQVATAVWWFAGKAQFFFVNLTTSDGWDLSTPSGPPGASAEWIVERPTIQVGYAALSKYGTESPYNLAVDTTGDVNNAKYVPAGNFPGATLNMVQKLPDATGSGYHDGATMPEVTSQSGGNMTTTWRKYY